MVWEGNEAGERFCIHTTTPHAKHSRRDKYDIIAKFLVDRFNLPKPEYVTDFREREINEMRRQAGTWTP